MASKTPSGKFANDPICVPVYDPKKSNVSPLQFYLNVGRSRARVVSQKNPYKKGKEYRTGV